MDERSERSERRKHVRFNTSTIVQFKDGIFSANTDTLTKDVSLGGVCFFSEKKLTPGKILKLRLFHDGKKPAKCINGKITWMQECNDKISKGYLIGVTFKR